MNFRLGHKLVGVCLVSEQRIAIKCCYVFVISLNAFTYATASYSVIHTVNKNVQLCRVQDNMERSQLLE